MGRQTNLDFDHAKLTFRYFVVTPLTLLELPEISAIWKLSMNLHVHAFSQIAICISNYPNPSV